MIAVQVPYLPVATPNTLEAVQQGLGKRMEREETNMPPTRKRRRVHFNHDDEAPESINVRVCETMYRSSQMTDEEKGTVWIQDGCFRENVQKTRLQATMIALQGKVDNHVRNYAEALMTTYASCTLEQESEISDRCAQHLALSEIEHVSAAGESTRGLEKVAVPIVGSETIRRRYDAINAVLLAQLALSQEPPLAEKDEIIQSVYQEYSRCARTFAKAMGTADAMSALIEYGNADAAPPLVSISPPISASCPDRQSAMAA